MNRIQMLNIWRLFRIHTLEPMSHDDEQIYPTWFWSDYLGSTRDWSFMAESGKLSGFDKFLLDLARFNDDELPVYFYKDSESLELSWIKYEKVSSDHTYRSWLTRKENEERNPNLVCREKCT